MEKKYYYNKTRYAVRVLGIGYFAIFLCLYGLYRTFTTGLSIANCALILIDLYIIYETFITCANPNEVIISDKKIIPAAARFCKSTAVFSAQISFVLVRGIE